MSQLKSIIFFAIFCLFFNTGILQPNSKSVASLVGYINLNINASGMKDTAGVFCVRLGGEVFCPKIVNGKLVLKYHMEEPRSASLVFYPRDN
ncbi:hypothetical protein A0256_13480 [Mucilaginibacter sp. PAMC 26640]|nr:hypothetical protein A0256_13480 [Mucilaginibacter sp. PAMC 26640]